VARKRVAVFGSSRIVEQDPRWRLAYEVGEVIARRDCSLVSGGYEGAMGAVSEGAAAAGGHVLGITTEIFDQRQANRWVEELFVQPDYIARMSALLRAGDAFVVLGGALGTASEWLTAWCLASIGQLPGPLFVFEEPWRSVVTSLEELPEMGERLSSHLQWVATAADLDAGLLRWGEESSP
jgi:uncharacterized protein (TIGR00730 family)